MSGGITQMDLTGQKFGKLTVVERDINKGKHSVWRCECDCGRTHVVIATNLRQGSVTACRTCNPPAAGLIARRTLKLAECVCKYLANKKSANTIDLAALLNSEVRLHASNYTRNLLYQLQNLGYIKCLGRRVYTDCSGPGVLVWAVGDRHYAAITFQLIRENKVEPKSEVA